MTTEWNIVKTSARAHRGRRLWVSDEGNTGSSSSSRLWSGTDFNGARTDFQIVSRSSPQSNYKNFRNPHTSTRKNCNNGTKVHLPSCAISVVCTNPFNRILERLPLRHAHQRRIPKDLPPILPIRRPVLIRRLRL